MVLWMVKVNETHALENMYCTRISHMRMLTGQTDSFSTVTDIQQDFHLKHQIYYCSNELKPKKAM